MSERKHLPLYGPGPAFMVFSVVLSVSCILLSWLEALSFGRLEVLRTPLTIVGILALVFGWYLNYSAKKKSRLFEMVAENRLITTGVYGIVRNPVYSAMLLMNFGIVCLLDNLVLFASPLLCWGFETVVLKRTEEQWLAELYGEEYRAYCERVNRLIPWFPKGQ